MWREDRPWLMKLSASGHVYKSAYGSLRYLCHLAGKATTSRGRQWIESPLAPAHIEPSSAYRITKHVLAR